MRTQVARMSSVSNAVCKTMSSGGDDSREADKVKPVDDESKAKSSVGETGAKKGPKHEHRISLQAALKPVEVVSQLDKYIVGQADAKRAVAIALRNRWRRHMLPEDLKNEVIPKNILMIGPTGCGKTEIARRIAKLSQAPFIKVEATKYTEVGFHGKDVDQIIRDLVDVSIAMTKKRIKEGLKKEVINIVNDKLLNALVGAFADEDHKDNYRNLLKEGALEDRPIEIEIPARASGVGNNFTGDMSGNPNSIVISEIFRAVKGTRLLTHSLTHSLLTHSLTHSLTCLKGGGGKKSEKKTMTISEARPLLEELESDRLLDDQDVVKEAIANVEESGIVFIDEIDKLVSSGDHRGADASSEGVQRDLLPLIEGSSIQTKHGNVNTDFILFIASGAFHSTKPSDLLAELQGRLPIRVTLKGLTQEDLHRILTEPVNNLLRQQTEMLKCENVDLNFTPEAVKEIARVTFETNKSVENIGARRLHTVIERVIEDISFDASSHQGEKIVVDEEYVKKRVGDLLTKSDLRKYIL